jgi:hypothetical protein
LDHIKNKIGNKKTFQQDMHLDLREKESASYILNEIDNNWEIYKNQKNALAKTLYHSHKSIFNKKCFFNI